MALSNQNSNWISRVQSMAEALLLQQRQIDLLIAQWNQNDMFNTLTDADIAAQFPHLTKGEVTEAVNALTAVTNALGSLSSGQAVNLVKMQG